MTTPGDGGGGGLRAARLRRIDDARQLQQQRRQQALEPSASSVPQQHLTEPGQCDEAAHAVPPPAEPRHGYDGDAHTLTSTPSAVMSPASSTRSTRMALSAKRHNMMQRRIEMRRRNEERERQLQSQSQQQQQGQQLPQQATRDSYDQPAVQQEQQKSDVAQRPSHGNQPQHYEQAQEHVQQSQPQPDMPQQKQRQYGHASSVPRVNHSGMGYDATHLQNGQHYGQGGPRGQQQQPQYMAQHPSHHGFQQAQSAPRYNNYQQPYLHQQMQQLDEQHSRARRPPSQQYPPQPPPMAISSPPMLQRRQQYGQTPIYQGTEGTISQDSPEFSRNMPDRPVGVYKQEELERSGIIRHGGQSSHGQPTNQLRKFSPYDSPSDEWHGYNGYSSRPGLNRAGLTGVQQQPARNHQYQQPVQQYERPPQSVRNQYHNHAQQATNPQYHQPRQGQHLPPQPGSQMANNASHVLQGNRGSHVQGQETLPTQQQQQQQQNHPNWHDIDERHRDSHRQRLYQRQIMRAQQQQQQQQQHGSGQVEQQNQQLQQQPQNATRPPALSPVEHLGNRSDQIRWKSSKSFSVSPNRSVRSRPGEKIGTEETEPGKHQPSRSPIDRRREVQYGQLQQQYQHQSVGSESHHGHNVEDGGSIVSVSDQARRFEQAVVPASDTRGRRGKDMGENGSRSRSLSRSRAPSELAHQRFVPTHQQAAQSSRTQSYVDEDGTVETLSVASLRKGWEGKQQKPRSKSTGGLQTTPNRAFGVWEERANRLARARRREQRREQRKNIEERWMQQRNATAMSSRVSLPPPERKQSVHYHDGYQSEGPPQRQSRNYGNDGYQSEGGPDHLDEGQEMEYGEKLEVDSAAITPQDARRRLWDGKERLRAVLPRNESFDSIGNVRERWPHEQGDSPNGVGGHENRNSGEFGGSPPRMSAFGSPSNHSVYSGTSSAGGRFKSKFVHAAALATQNRVANEKLRADTDADEYFPQQAPQQSGYEEEQGKHRRPKHKNDHPRKNELAASSHYTDSTAEMTNNTSYGSSHRRAASHSNTTRFVRRVSPSPPKRPTPHPSASTMPSIDEAAPQTQATSVADLISRINAVSRSNPEEALAAIDDIIQKEGGNTNDAEPQNVPRNDNGGTRLPVSRSPKSFDQFSPSNANRSAPPPTNQEGNAARHLARDYFQESYEEVLRTDSERVIRGRVSLELNPDDDDDDDSLLSSSAESTVSSMTDPTYQSLRSEQFVQRKGRSNAAEQQGHSQTSQPHLPDKPKKSWDTLRREYSTRKASPPLPEQSAEPQRNKSKRGTATKTPHNDIGVEEFDPDDIAIDRVDTGEFVSSTGFCGMNYGTSSSKNKSSIEVDANAPQTPSTMTESAWVPFGGAAGHRKEPKNPRVRRQAPAQTNRSAVVSNRDQQSRRPSTANGLQAKSHALDMPKLVDQRNSTTDDLNLATTPEQKPRATIATKRASTPEIMMAVSNAFSNVDISLEASAPSKSKESHRVTEVHDDPPLEHMQSLGSLEEQLESPLQTISEAFSDVDVSFEQEKSASERRKELEYLSRSWTVSKSNDGGLGSSSSSSFRVPPRNNVTRPPKPESTHAATSWANEPPTKSSRATHAATAKLKKMAEPTLRLKGNRTLAKKFASLVKAYDD